jgi:hypothetical protein
MPAIPPVVCTAIRRVGKGALKAFVNIHVAEWKITFYSCRWLEKDGRQWIDLPQCQWVDSDGNTQYRETVQFDDRETAGRFSSAALAAIKRLFKQSRRP